MPYIAGVYEHVSGAAIIENDIRCEEVRKLLTSFPKESYARVTYFDIDIIVDNTVIYKTVLKTPPQKDLPVLYIDTQMLLREIDENCLISCPWVEQNYNWIMSRMMHGPLLAQQSNLRDDPEFEKLLEFKSGDGMRFYKVPAFEKYKVYMIPVFTGFPNLNKQDTASIEIYAYNEISVIVIMKIFKKKFNREISMIYKILDITRNGNIGGENVY